MYKINEYKLYLNKINKAYKTTIEEYYIYSRQSNNKYWRRFNSYLKLDLKKQILHINKYRIGE